MRPLGDRDSNRPEEIMKIVFISANRLKRVLPPMPLGLASIIAQVDESRHEFRVLDLMFMERPEEQVLKTLKDFCPDLIAISIRNVDNQCSLRTEYYLPEAKALVDLCREQSEAAIVVGGPAFTVSPAAVFAYLGPDFGIAGEGETAFPELVERLEEKRDWSDIPGLVWQREDGIHVNPVAFIEDLDTPKMPRRDLFDNERYASERGLANIVVKQGCVFNCLYCDSPHTLGRRWRMKSPERVANELEHMQKDLGITLAFFSDPIFNCPPEHARAVCEAIKRRGLSIGWVASAHPAFIDRESLALMREAGCAMISLGCDSCSDKMLEVYRKGFTKKRLAEAIDLLEEREMNYILSILLGGPGETPETVKETIQFLEPRSPFFLDFCVGIRLMPHTDLAKIAVREGVIAPSDPLMAPRFYCSADIRDWVEDYLREACSRHHNWTVAHEEP
jgi:radical SAM superfamily enzyme YgiQ (UPF0313 family)